MHAQARRNDLAQLIRGLCRASLPFKPLISGWVNHPAQAGARLKGTRIGPRTGRKGAPLDSVELAK